MKAISIRQPWAWAIMHAGKRVENRDWRSAPSYRGPLLIHAAKGCTRDEFMDAFEAMRDVKAAGGWKAESSILPKLSGMPRGAIVAHARLVDVVYTLNQWCRVSARGEGIICQLCGEVSPRAHNECGRPDPWAVPGSLGLILADVVPLAEPVPFKGALGFFDVPDGLVLP